MFRESKRLYSERVAYRKLTPICGVNLSIPELVTTNIVQENDNLSSIVRTGTFCPANLAKLSQRLQQMFSSRLTDLQVIIYNGTFSVCQNLMCIQ